jgi:hypothetical protein
MTRIRKPTKSGPAASAGPKGRAGSCREAEVGPDAFASGGQRSSTPLAAECGDEDQAAADFGVVICGEAGGHDVAGVYDLAAQRGGMAQQPQPYGKGRLGGGAWSGEVGGHAVPEGVGG